MVKLNSLPGFTLVCKNTRKKHEKARICSGGVSMYVKNSIAKGVSKLPFSHSDILWVRLDHNLFSLQRDIYLAIIYFSPENSSGAVKAINEMYSILLRNIEYYSQLGNIIIQFCYYR